ncbi:hypothetical protein EVAR_10126_1 [Eumeta japonica]|uniref:Uncharacterized protein n=1 Tax=Eumeta variegata TaxID=151549 RepID=A0A4C1UC45_EUMVA|nr:hypothetical protein EVAR_10126_1 [Eumeta japonica]
MRGPTPCTGRQMTSERAIRPRGAAPTRPVDRMNRDAYIERSSLVRSEEVKSITDENSNDSNGFQELRSRCSPLSQEQENGLHTQIGANTWGYR